MTYRIHDNKNERVDVRIYDDISHEYETIYDALHAIIDYIKNVDDHVDDIDDNIEQRCSFTFHNNECVVRSSSQRYSHENDENVLFIIRE